MKQALAAYLGGLEIVAQKADYETYRELGLLCPCCKEPVFYRSGYSDKLGKKYEPCFVHYSRDKSAECEHRILTKQGRLELEKAKQAGKNQRLELYNRRLWELFCHDRSDVMQPAPFEIKSKIIKAQSAVMQKLCQEDRVYFGKFIIQYFEGVDRFNIFELDEKARLKKNTEFDRQATLEHTLYFQNKVNQQLHEQILNEIVDFLGTKKSLFFWRQLLEYVLNHLCLDNRIRSNSELANFIVQMNPDYFYYEIATVLASTFWADAIAAIFARQ